jgi:hypothetical protein
MLELPLLVLLKAAPTAAVPADAEATVLWHLNIMRLSVSYCQLSDSVALYAQYLMLQLRLLPLLLYVLCPFPPVLRVLRQMP